MKSLIAGCIRRPVSVGMFTVAACVFGFVALGRLPVNLLPEISYPTLTVETRMPGAAPIEVETLVTRPIEEAASVVPGLRRVTSRSRAGASEVTLEFVWDTNMDFAGLDVREKLDSVLLPEDAERPRLLRFDPASDAIFRIGVSGDLPLSSVRQWTEEDLKKDLDAVDGVAAVRIEGGLVREIQVDVDEGRLAAYGITVAEVRDALAANNVNLAGGSVYEDEARYLVRTLNELDTLDRIRAVIVKDTEGRLVRLRDVAEVRSGFKDQEVILRQGGAEGVEVRIFKEGDANTVQVAEGVRSRLEALEESVPAELALAVLFDQSRFIEGAISEVVRNAWEGGLLAILVIALFLRDRRSTAVVAMAIPVSVIATFFVMQQMGLSLNIMSLGGLALGVGMLLDDSIVVLEAIHRRHAGGEGARESAVSGTVEVAGPVIASTLTTVAVFLPIVFVEGVAGQLFRDQALTVSISILASLGFSLALIPVLSSRGVMTPGAAGDQRATTAVRALRGLRRGLRWCGRALMFPVRPVASGFTAAEGAVARAYPPVLRAALRHPVTVFTLAAGLLAGSLAVGRAGIGVELIPALSQGEFHFDVHLPEGSAVTATDTVVDAVGESAQEDPAVLRVTTEAGTATGGGFAGSAGRAEHQGRVQITMADPGDKLAEAAVIERIRADLAGQPGVRYEFGRPSYFSFRQPVEVEVYSEDRTLLVPSARRVQTAVADVPGLADVRSTAEAGSPEIRVHFAADRLASLGLTVDQASEGLRSKLRGEVATRLDEGDRRIDVMVRGSEGLRSRTAAVPELIVHAEQARPVPLRALGNAEVGEGPAELRRVGQRPAVVISGNLDGTDLEGATEAIDSRIAGLGLAPGVSTRFGGQREEMERSFASLALAIGLAIFLVYFVMASQFESLLHPFLILFTIPLAAIGVVWALLLSGSTLSVIVLIGVVMLAGIVVKNAIVLVDCINRLRRDGMEKAEAIVAAGQIRLRPILMTTLTTILGLTPMALGLGEGAEIRGPMAITVIGGLLVSTLLTLVVIPTAYSVFDRKRFAE
ncbi:MAG: efflux RND transporter permease subunit [Acidobacteria bacterium]|nr:efflux RND transporter permease subunit [Acidobacteriota bacterium]